MNEVKRKVHYFCKDTLQGKCAGQGITAAVLDTGISLHPDFDRRIKAFQDFVNGKQMIYDDCSHGTHVAGILAGSGKISGYVYSGMAPACDLCIVKVLDDKGNGSVEQLLKGIEWILQNRWRYRIRLVNLSMGMVSGEAAHREAELIRAVEHLWDEGLIVVVSAGNTGPEEGSVAVPGNSGKVITVGAQGSLFSGRGPTKDLLQKPDLTAPGTHVISCNGNYTTKRSAAYIAKTGTSMATPVVTGAIALLLSKYPDLDNSEVKNRLRICCGESLHVKNLLRNDCF